MSANKEDRYGKPRPSQKPQVEPRPGFVKEGGKKPPLTDQDTRRFPPQPKEKR